MARVTFWVVLFIALPGLVFFATVIPACLHETPSDPPSPAPTPVPLQGMKALAPFRFPSGSRLIEGYGESPGESRFVIAKVRVPAASLAEFLAQPAVARMGPVPDREVFSDYQHLLQS